MKDPRRMDLKKILSYSGLASFVVTIISIVLYMHNISSDKMTLDERLAALDEYYSYCEKGYCQDEQTANLIKTFSKIQETALYALKVVTSDPRLTLTEDTAVKLGEHEIKKEIKKYSLMLENKKTTNKIVAAPNSKLNVSILYDGVLVNPDPQDFITFMYSLDPKIAIYNGTNHELITFNEGKTTLLLVDGLYRKEFDIIVK